MAMRPRDFDSLRASMGFNLALGRGEEREGERKVKKGRKREKQRKWKAKG